MMSKELTEQENNQLQYQVKILGALNQVFQEDSEFFISTDELFKGDNATDFFHALANLVPNRIYQELTSNEGLSNLEFNHIANRLCFQFSKKE